MNSTTRVPDLPRVNISFYKTLCPLAESERSIARVSMEIGLEFLNFRTSIRTDVTSWHKVLAESEGVHASSGGRNLIAVNYVVR